MKQLTLLCLLLTSIASTAQVEENRKAKSGVLFSATTTFDIPAGDMADRFGNSFSLGGGFIYKTQKNLYFQIFSEFIQGNTVRQKNIFGDIGYSDLQLYDYNGNLRNVEVAELGMNLGIGLGKTILLNKTKSLDNGINFMTSLSLLQHRINHVDPDRVLVQALGDYAKGYDYLTNGLCINQSVSYIHFSRNALTNFSLGVNARLGFTRNRRSVNFVTGTADDRLRSDFMLGLHFRWLIPLYKNVESDIYF